MQHRKYNVVYGLIPIPDRYKNIEVTYEHTNTFTYKYRKVSYISVWLKHRALESVKVCMSLVIWGKKTH